MHLWTFTYIRIRDHICINHSYAAFCYLMNTPLNNAAYGDTFRILIGLSNEVMGKIRFENVWV